MLREKIKYEPHIVSTAGRGKEELKSYDFMFVGTSSCHVSLVRSFRFRRKGWSCLDWGITSQEVPQANLTASPGNWTV